MHKFCFGSKSFSECAALKTAVFSSLPYYVLCTEKKNYFVFKTHQKMIKGVQSVKIKALPQGCVHNPSYSPSHLAFHSPVFPCLEIV